MGVRRLVLLLLVAWSAAPGCAWFSRAADPLPSYAGFPLERFDRVDENLYRGAHPSRAQLRELVARFGIRTVVKLNPDWQGDDEIPPGVVFIDAPIPAVFTPDPVVVDRILDAIDRAPKPVFVHCRTGADRAGLIVALYKLRHGATVVEARADMVRHGFRPYRGMEITWRRAVADLERRRPGGGVRVTAGGVRGAPPAAR